jgi:hypothetical protein
VLVHALFAFLQGLDWHNDPEIMKSIISFYTKVWTAALVIFRGLRSPVQAVPAPLSHSTLPYTPSPHLPSRRARTSSLLASMTRVPRWRSTSTGTTRRCAGLCCVPPCEPQPHSAKPRVPGSARIPLSGELLFLDPPPPLHAPPAVLVIMLSTRALRLTVPMHRRGVSVVVVVRTGRPWVPCGSLPSTRARSAAGRAAPPS